MKRVGWVAAVVITLLPAIAMTTGAATARQLSGTSSASQLLNTVCLTNDLSMCMDLKDNHVADGQRIWLYNVNQANGAIWFAQTKGFVCADTSNCGSRWWPFTSHVLDSDFAGNVVEVFQKAENNVGDGYYAGESAGQVVLSKGEVAGTEWVNTGGNNGGIYLVNVNYSDSLDGAQIMTAASNSNTADIFLGSPTPGEWQNWTCSNC